MVRRNPSDGEGGSGRSGPASSNPLLDAAVQYAVMGWRVVPNKVRSKRPRIDDWVNAASSDVEVVNGWWKVVPNGNVAVALGSRSGIVAIDNDSDAGTRMLLEMSGGDLPDTCEMTTGKGSRLLYAIPDGLDFEPRTVANLKDEHGKEALRLQGHGNQCVMPPSIHPGDKERGIPPGRVYAWVEGRSPADWEPAPMPGWLIEAMRPGGLADEEHPERPAWTDAVRPGVPRDESFNLSADWWTHVLEPAGFTPSRPARGDRGSRRYCRPGKDDHSVAVTVGYYQAKDGTDALHVFSSSIPGLDAGKTYDMFGAFARLFYHGDFAAAARAAVARGIITARPRQPQTRITWGGRPIGDGRPGASGGTTADAADSTPTNGPAHDTSTEPRFRFITSAELAGGDYRPTWLVPKLLVKNQPGVIAGPSKSMKTSALIDLAVSLASGRPFLGEFAVPKPFRAAIVSGESGAHTIQETARRVCNARGVDLAALDRLRWCFDLPVLAHVGEMAEFTDLLAGLGAEVVIIDPLYLALGGDIDHANMFEMGARLRATADTLLKAGITPILVHHANRQLRVGEPMELTHLAYSGLEQFARQFLLVNRREPYQSDGVHDLWLRAGGSAGHGGLWGVHIEEGLTGEDFGGREWNVTVQTTAETAAGVRERREQAKEDKRRAAVRADGTTVLTVIDREASAGRKGATLSRIKAVTGFRHDKANAAVQELFGEGVIEPGEVVIGGGNGAQRSGLGWRRRGA